MSNFLRITEHSVFEYELHNVWIAIYITLLLLSAGVVSTSGHDAVLTYTRDKLLTLQTQVGSFKHHIPMDCMEIGQITIILTHVPGPKHQEATGRIAESYNTALSLSPSASAHSQGL